MKLRTTEVTEREDNTMEIIGASPTQYYVVPS